ncbi:MAG TPA: threonine--tRNA ligase [Anaerolineaceae bacterium]|nr:threonine--tRNA ligase [Anaerolineaceae bacterium]HPA34630.1 threonine--tRNA ligase [Anaerolineaceae bacterium]HQH36590.1 threonine--tRNA ligase [Anaerolineaceae bacterium]HQJ04605.1 threonine--tRNA ligase [Anaerolineaceae bacterium]HQO98878.1 threonine--tRNA ligase [Anaerolineaceae bacterium]
MSDKKEVYEESELYRIRHSTAHIMAQAVLEQFPDGKVAIGPAIDDGFYYDFDLPRPLTPEDLEKIERRMRSIIQSRVRFERRVVNAEEARQIFHDQPYKLELIAGLEEGKLDEDGNPVTEKPEISIYAHEGFVDLCRGPHVEVSSQINPAAVKLLSVAGAYWRGDERRPMLQRIYGTAWNNPQELKDYLWRIEEAKKRDHRKIGHDLDLFSSVDEIGAGLILWHPKGAKVRKLVENFWSEEHEKSGYDFVYTPHIGKSQLWETSGHLGFYKENMYSPIDIEGQQYYLKPMNCPFHIHIYKSSLRSYRDLPIRYAEEGTVYRFERSGVMHGLMRVRGFTQDDAHHFCRPDQMPAEIDFVLDFSLHILRSFGFTDIHAYLSTKPEKAVGEPERWIAAEAALRASLERAGVEYDVDQGGGAFYGPKIDLKVKDAIGREWQLSTIQFDFNNPERFDLTYIGEDGQPHRPYMVHRALLGSLERFFGVLIEHYAGAFPVWLSPVQAALIPIADRHVDYAREVAAELRQAGLRVMVDDRGERMNAKIRDAQNQKIPYMLVVGDKEVENRQVALRLRNGENPGPMAVAEFLDRAKDEVARKV